MAKKTAMLTKHNTENIEQHECHYKPGVSSGRVSSLNDPATLVTPVMLLVKSL